MMASVWTEEDSRAAAEKIIKRAEISKVRSNPAASFCPGIKNARASPSFPRSVAVKLTLQITRRLKSRLSLVRDKTQELTSPRIDSFDSRSSVSGASSDSRLPTPTSFPASLISAAPIENPFLVPTPTLPPQLPPHHHRKSHSRSSAHNLTGTLKPPMTDTQPRRKRSRTATTHAAPFNEFMYPTHQENDLWRPHQSSPIRAATYDPSISHLNPQVLQSPFPQVTGGQYTSSGSRITSSPPSTPPSAFRRRAVSGTGEEGADLLLFLATSPSPAQTSSRRFAGTPGTPPFVARRLDPATPSQSFDVRDYINITPSPAPQVWGSGTPRLGGTPSARRRLTYEEGPGVIGSPVELSHQGLL
jgi:hypothetical protein